MSTATRSAPTAPRPASSRTRPLHTPHSALRACPAFTLVELLTVIVIIAILAGLISVAAMTALEAAKNAAIKTELDQLHTSLAAYAADSGGAYPPSDFTGNLASPTHPVHRHLLRKFPRMQEQSAVWSQLQGLTPAQALVFWLGGFSKDVLRPLTGPGGPLSQTPLESPLLPFAKERLVQPGGSGMPVYMPPRVQDAPYYYFDARSYDYFSNTPVDLTGLNKGFVRPYYLDTNGDGAADGYVNEDTFQLISAGLDGHYGANAQKVFPTGANYAPEDGDNLTNFSDRKLRDAIP